MMRKLVVALTLMGAFFALDAYALGLTNIEVLSKLNENLNARIKILSIPKGDMDNIKVSLASPAAFQRAGLEYSYVLSSLRFAIPENSKDRSQLSAVITVTTSQPVKEPFLNFLVEVSWPNGRILREYTALLDPPLYTPKTVPVEQLPDTKKSTFSKEPTKRVGKVSPATSKVPLSAGSSKRISGSSRSNYTTVSNDTLWRIAMSSRPRSTSLQQHMVNIYRANPNAFINRNMNLLKQGVMLNIPGGSPVEPKAMMAATERTGMSDPAVAPESTTEQSTKKPLSTLGEQARVTLTPPGSGSSSSAGDPSAPQQGGVSPELRNQLDNAKAEVASIRKENQELKSQLNENKSTLENMKRQLDELNKLVKLQNQEMAKLQEQLNKKIATAPKSPDNLVVADAGKTAITDGTKKSLSTEPSKPLVIPPETTKPESGIMPLVGSENPDTTTTGTTTPATLTGNQGTTPTADKPAGTTPPASGTPPDQGSPTGAEPPKPPGEGDKTSEPPQSSSPDEDWLTKVTNTATSVTNTTNEVVNESVPGGWLTVGGGILGLLLIMAIIVALKRRRERSSEVKEDEIEAELVRLGIEEREADGSSTDEISAEKQIEDLMREVEQDQHHIKGETLDEDLLDEVDLYINYDKLDRAEELIRSAVEQHPDQLGYRVKLLEVLAAARKTDEFEEQARLVQSATEGEGPYWDKTEALWATVSGGKKLSSGGELASKDEKKGISPGLVAGGIAAAGAAGLVGAAILSSGDEETESTEENAHSEEDAGLDFNLDGDHGEITAETEEFSLDLDSDGTESGDLSNDDFSLDLDGDSGSDEIEVGGTEELESLNEEEDISSGDSDSSLDLDGGGELEASDEDLDGLSLDGESKAKSGERSLDDNMSLDLDSGGEFETGDGDLDGLSLDDDFSLDGETKTESDELSLGDDDLSLNLDSDGELESGSEGTEELSLDDDLSLGDEGEISTESDDLSLDLESDGKLESGSEGTEELSLDDDLSLGDEGEISTESDDLSLDLESDGKLEAGTDDLSLEDSDFTLEDSKLSTDGDLELSLEEDSLDDLSESDLASLEEGDIALDDVGGDIDNQFELVQMYIDMEDKDSAKVVLEEIIANGDAGQKRKAEELMAEIS